VEVVLVDGRTTFVERVRLHEDVAGTVRTETPFERVLDGTGATFRLGWASEVDLGARRLRFADASTEPFDDLVLATGSTASRPSIPGVEHAHSCTTREDATLLVRRLEEVRGGRVIVIGGGLTGIELATELAERRTDLRMTLVTAGDVAAAESEGARAYVRSALGALGVEIHENARVAACERDAVVLVDGTSLPADIVVWAGGMQASPVGAQAGIAVDVNGRALVEEHLRSTTHPFVRVVGDAALVTVPGPAGEAQALRMACATALPLGAYAADDLASELAGRESAPFRFAYAAHCVSLGRRRGLVQRVDAWDRAEPLHLRGRPAAWFKEGICRFAAFSVAAARRGLHYRWPKPRLTNAPRALATS